MRRRRIKLYGFYQVSSNSEPCEVAFVADFCVVFLSLNPPIYL